MLHDHIQCWKSKESSFENSNSFIISDEELNVDGEWCPPSSSQQKMLAARKERQDKISKAIGDYLLKGYKMLASSCSTCGVRFTLVWVDLSVC